MEGEVLDRVKITGFVHPRKKNRREMKKEISS